MLAFDAMDSAATDDMVYYFAGMEGVRFKRPVFLEIPRDKVLAVRGLRYREHPSRVLDRT